MSTDWPWPDALDALSAAPQQHRLLFENAHVRVLDTRTVAMGATPTALWGEALGAHTLENVGTATIHVISTEVKPTGAP
jgi:hypothetical protein